MLQYLSRDEALPEVAGLQGRAKTTSKQPSFMSLERRRQNLLVICNGLVVESTPHGGQITQCNSIARRYRVVAGQHEAGTVINAHIEEEHEKGPEGEGKGVRDHVYELQRIGI